MYHKNYALNFEMNFTFQYHEANWHFCEEIANLNKSDGRAVSSQYSTPVANNSEVLQIKVSLPN